MPIRYPSLPILEDDELTTIFGDDHTAVQRFHILEAILTSGHSQSRAAAESCVSQRTVRNVLYAYRRGGLDALRSRPVRRGVSARRVAFEPAVAAALADDPLAGGDRIWRRAQALLGEAGGALSRRTAYRILAGLRLAPGPVEHPDALLSLLRTALPLLPEEPPLALGSTALAQRLLPTVAEQRLRGELLQRALRQAISRLRPAAEIPALDRGWWPYLICAGEYDSGRSRAELQRELALSASTYSRAKRQALVQIAGTLGRLTAELTDVPSAQAERRLPRTADFVGRRAEQAFYTWRLDADRLAWIWGLPGSGKTALAAELAAEARRSGQAVVWHTCRPGLESSAEGLLNDLALSLDDETETDAATLDWAAFAEQLRARERTRTALLVIDDAHHLADGAAEALRTTLDQAALRSVQLLFVGRERPANGKWPHLPGLQEDEAQLLWEGLPPLPPDQWRALYTTTGGLPYLLRRVAAAARRPQADSWLAEVAYWAEDELWARFNEHERRLALVAQALDGRPWAGHAERILAALDIPITALVRLKQLGLLTVVGVFAAIHPTLRLGATSRLREDRQLNGWLAALALTIAEAAQPALDNETGSGKLAEHEAEEQTAPLAIEAPRATRRNGSSAEQPAFHPPMREPGSRQRWQRKTDVLGRRRGRPRIERGHSFSVWPVAELRK